jgi:hypothetical protein
MSEQEFEQIWRNIPREIRKFVWKQEYRKSIEKGFSPSQFSTHRATEGSEISENPLRDFQQYLGG